MKLISIVVVALLILSIACFINYGPNKKALEASCRNNLKLIWNAICIYDQKFHCIPNNLERLVDNGLINVDNLKCPFANIDFGLFSYRTRQLRIGSDYDYFPPPTLASDIEIPICRDKHGNHGKDGYNILYLGGMVLQSGVRPEKGTIIQ